ncbi:MAG: hypothetical protein QNJ98_08200 [Planctomycetota bacterium]|nr:hypothetical protein [Planctomycetota bacterium]
MTSRSLRPSALVLFLAALLGATAPAAADAARRLRIDVELTALRCFEESDEHGSDDPYVVLAYVNLRSGRVHVDSYQFKNVETGHSRFPSGAMLRAHDDVQHPDDAAVLVGLMEWDRDSAFGSGYVTREGPGIWWTPEVKTRVTRDLQAFAGGMKKAYAAGHYSAGHYKQELLMRMRQAMNASRGDDEVLGLALLDTRGQTAGPGVRLRRRATPLRYREDGSRYELRFDVGHTRLTTPRMLRVQVIDSVSRKHLPARYEVTRGKAVIAKGKTNAKGRIERRLEPGRYAIKLSAAGYGARRYDVQIDAKDVYIGAELLPRVVKAKMLPPQTLEPLPPKAPLGGVTTNPSFSGQWTSSIATLVITHTGKRVTARVIYPNGIEVRLWGDVSNGRLDFKWGPGQLELGHGTLELSADKKRLSGHVFNKLDNTNTPWTLTRKS